MLPLTYLAAACHGTKLFEIIPTWYEFLPSQTDANGYCTPSLQNIADIWLIVLAVVEMLLRIATLAAIIFIIYGGIMYTTSQGAPESTAKAKDTLINALIGLIISIAASAIVAFIAGQF